MCGEAHLLFYLDRSYGLLQRCCCGQTRLAAGVTGKSSVRAKGQGNRSGVDPPGEDEGKRKGRRRGK